jgi:predicted amidophosphoribosyltransferase
MVKNTYRDVLRSFYHRHKHHRERRIADFMNKAVQDCLARDKRQFFSSFFALEHLGHQLVPVF